MKHLLALTLAISLVGCESEGDGCFSKVKVKLTDPESATLTAWDKVGTTVRANLRVSNGTGGFVHMYGLCRADGFSWVSKSDSAEFSYQP